MVTRLAQAIQILLDNDIFRNIVTLHNLMSLETNSSYLNQSLYSITPPQGIYKLTKTKLVGSSDRMLVIDIVLASSLFIKILLHYTIK